MANDRVPVILDLQLDADQFKRDVQNIEVDIAELQHQITKIANQKNFSSFTKETKTATTRFVDAARKYAEARKGYIDSQRMRVSAEKETDALAKYFDAYRKLNSAAREYHTQSDLSADFQAGVKEVEKLKAQLDQVNEKSKELYKVGASDRAWETLNVRAETLKEKIYAATNELKRMIDTQKAWRSGAFNEDWDVGRLEELNNAIKRMRKETQGIVSSIKVKKDTNTPEYTEAYQKQLKEVERLEAALDKAKEKYNKLLATGGDTPKALAGMRYDLERIEEKAQTARDRLAEMVKSGEAFKVGRGDAAAELNRIDEATTRIADDARKLHDETQRTAGGLSNVAGGFKHARKEASGLVNGAKKIAGTIKSTIVGIKKLISNFAQLRKHGNKSTNGLADGFKKLQRHILMFGFGFRTAYFAIKRLRRVFMDAYKTMAAQFPEINAELNSFTMSLNRLKGSLGTMFQPIISVAIPILVRLMEYLSRAMEVAANFFAVLTGQRVIYRAISNQENYADSLNDTADAEARVRKEHEKTVASYDKLDIIDQNKGANTGNSNNSAPNLPLNVTYEEVPIESAISDFAERIKRAWAAADFTEIGEIITEKALKILENFRVNILPKITDFINRLANIIITFVNGADFGAIGDKIGDIINDLIDQLDAQRLGEALASIYNTVIRFADGLINGIEWEQVGQNIAEFIRGLVENIDINALINAISGLANGLMTGLDGLIEGVPWEQYAGKLGEAINRLFDKIDLGDAGTTLGGLAGTLITSLGTLLTTLDWGAMATDLSTFASNFIQEITDAIKAVKWDQVGEGISEFIKNFDTEQLANDVMELIKSITVAAFDLLRNTDWKEAGEKVSGAIVAIIQGLTDVLAQMDHTAILDAINGFISGLKWEDILASIIEHVGATIGDNAKLIASTAVVIWDLLSKAWDEVVNWWHDHAYDEDGNFIIEGLLEGIKNALINIALWIYDHIFAPFINGFKKAFGIQSPSKEMEEQGEFIIAGLLNGIISAWEDIKQFFSDALDSIKQWATDAWQKVKDAWNGAATWFDENIIQPIAKFFSGLWEDISTAASDVWDGIKEVFNSVGDFFKNTFEKAWNAVVDVFSVAGDIFVDIKDGVVNAFKTIVNAIIRGINKVISVPFNGINWALQKLKDVNILGLKPFDWINTINVPQIPELAKGAVIPPNKEFLAILGDQKSGTNIEAPLDTIKQAVREVLGTNGNSAPREPISLQINGREIARVVWDENQKRYKQTGKFQSIYNM